VQGEGGFYEVPADLMRALRRICDENGIVLIADEVQTGFGRTGKLFAMEHFDIEPDVICVAKSLAGGFPLSGVSGRAAIMDAADPGGLGGTYAGNPVACAAALAVLDVIERDGLVARSNAIGARIKARLEACAKRNDVLPMAAVRGRGSMIAFDIMKARGIAEPDAEATKLVVRRAYENGLILLSCGIYGNGIRILVPLTAPDEIVDEGLGVLEKALAAD
jgi:4-aminobutyrate aminotransferase/(S)-3-amino-2-methylpropionate transaminase